VGILYPAGVCLFKSDDVWVFFENRVSDEFRVCRVNRHGHGHGASAFGDRLIVDITGKKARDGRKDPAVAGA